MNQPARLPLHPAVSPPPPSAAPVPPPGLPLGILITNTIGFALAFAVWVMLGPSVRVVSAELGIAPSSAALLKSAPILVGATMRIPIGIATDRFGARRMFPLLLLIGSAGVFALSAAGSMTGLFAGALVLGIVGATFAVGVQSVSSWTPKTRQGVALGVFGAGNIGTALTTFGMPLLLGYGWRPAFRLYGAVLICAAIGYWLVVRDAPRTGRAPSMRELIAPIASPRVWCFGLYYVAAFGVFVAATLSLGDVYIDGYKVTIQQAGLLATTFTFGASLCRIPGGVLSDRFGARPVVKGSLVVITAALAPVTLGVPLAVAVALVFVAGVAMGVGMAGTFKLIPDAFPDAVGAVGGIVGALGGLGGFLLPLASTGLRSATGSVYLQVAPLVAVALVATATAFLVERDATTAARPRVSIPVDRDGGADSNRAVS